MSKPIKYLSVCSGIEAASTAWHPLGWQLAGVAEIDPYPCHVLRQNWDCTAPRTLPEGMRKTTHDLSLEEGGTVPNFGDFTTITKDDYEPGTIDILVGGTPCFEGGTLIVTMDGLVPISEVIPGDFVMTHKGRFREVLRIGSKQSDMTVVLRGQGQSNGLVTTPEHPIYAAEKKRIWNNHERQYNHPLGEAEWIKAGDMEGKFWASPSSWEPINPPPIQLVGRESGLPEMSAELAYVIGRWLGDGWCRSSERRGYVLICCAKKESSALGTSLQRAGLVYNSSEERTTTRFQIASRAFARWLTDNFGSGAHGKTLPTWVYGWRHRRQLLQGYTDADGCKLLNGLRISTVSKKLALGTTLLAHSLGYSVSRRLVTPSREECIIEGREVNESPFWQITLYTNPRSSVERGIHRFGKVRHVDVAGPEIVHNLEVEEDNSYVADGIVVHNCQSFSIAGLRKGMDDSRGNLALGFCQLAARLRPRWVVWENVPGVLSSGKGRDFGCILGGLQECGYGVAWRILDAQWSGVAQRRRRVFVVGYLGDAARAAAVLFDRESLSGNPAPSREAGTRVAALTSSGVGIGGGKGSHWDGSTVHPTLNQSKNIGGIGLSNQEVFSHRGGGLVPETVPVSDVVGTLSDGAHQGGGLNEQDAYSGRIMPVVMASGQGNAPIDTDVISTLNCNRDGAPIVFTFKPSHYTRGKDGAPSDVVPPLSADADKGDQDPVVLAPVALDTTQITSSDNRSNPKPGPCHPPAICIKGAAIGREPHNGPQFGEVRTDGTCYTLNCRERHAVVTAVPQLYSIMPQNSGQDYKAREVGDNGRGAPSDIVPPLKAQSGQTGKGDAAPCVVHGTQDPITSDIALPLGSNHGQENVVHTNLAVRRLSPRECERLQGFPDDSTIAYSWPTRGKPAPEVVLYFLRTGYPWSKAKAAALCPDGPRYKALGNSMAVPVMRYIGERIQMLEDLIAEGAI